MEMLFIEAVDLGDTVDSVSIKIVDSKVRLKLDKIKVKKGFFSGDEFVFDFGRYFISILWVLNKKYCSSSLSFHIFEILRP